MFSCEQKKISIGDVTLGGQPGELPTVLMGSMFYRGDRLVSDHEKGVFDRQGALELLRAEEELSRQYCMPRIIDVVAETMPAMIKYVEFILESTESPFLVDSTLPEVKIEAFRYLAKLRVQDRAIYNSIDSHYREEEIACLRDCRVKSVVLLAFDLKYLMPKDRMTVLEGTGDKKGLIDLVKDAGVENILIDPGVLDLPSTSWSGQVIQMAKDKFGYPCGCAPSNALNMWRRKKKITSPLFESSGAAIFSYPIFCGADFVLYGPIYNCSWVYPCLAITDAMVAYGGRTAGIRPSSKNHPLYRIF